MRRTVVSRRVMTTIYALYDPRDGQARYVGRTVRRLEERLLDHLQYKDPSNRAKRDWIADLIAAGLRPMIRQLERVPAYDAAFAEARWIHTLQATGAVLLNGNRPGGPGMAVDTELTAQQAAVLLGCSDRSVRRWIARGQLAGRVEGKGRDATYRTTEMAVATFKALHHLSAKSPAETRVPPPSTALAPATLSELPADSPDSVGAPGADSVRVPVTPDQEGTLAAAVLAELSQTRRELMALAHENGRLQCEVGRLEAELALQRGQATGGEQTHRGQRVGVWERVGLWLKRNTRG